MGAIKDFVAITLAMIQDLHITISDLLDIAIMSYLLYRIARIIRETRATQLFKGIILLSCIFIAAKILGLHTLDFLFTNLFQIGVLVLIVLFQPELRRVLERVGRSKMSTVFGTDLLEKNADVWEEAIPQLVEAVKQLSHTNTGALIVIERQTKLGEQLATGVELNAKITTSLLLNIFFLNAPLHDGALILRDGRAHSAACFLPKPHSEDWISTHLGSRHRAAIGISEVSDAITIVVSEETGTVSITEDGVLHRGFSTERLHRYLRHHLLPQDAKKQKSSRIPWKKRKADEPLSDFTDP